MSALMTRENKSSSSSRLVRKYSLSLVIASAAREARGNTPQVHDDELDASRAEYQ